jgi:single-strand DNA-binding protein
MNKWVAIGRLTKDPEVDIKDTYTMARFTLAIDRDYQKDKEKKADFIMCKAFGKTAEFIGKWFSKGDPIVVADGTIQTHSYEKDGRTMYYTDALVRQVLFAPTKKSDKKEEVQDDVQDVQDDLSGDGLPF